MIFYQTKVKKISGSSYLEVKKNADLIFNKIKSKTKRRPYIRSAYFNKQKIFFDYFWTHLFQKSFEERFRRLKYFSCAIDLIKNSKNEPKIFNNPMKESEVLYRFAGSTKHKELFYVQIKENIKNDRKYLMSVFPE